MKGSDGWVDQRPAGPPPEAMALHYAANLAAKLQIAADFLASPEAQQPGHWTKRHWHLETRLYQGPRDEEEEG